MNTTTSVWRQKHSRLTFMWRCWISFVTITSNVIVNIHHMYELVFVWCVSSLRVWLKYGQKMLCHPSKKSMGGNAPDPHMNNAHTRTHTHIIPNLAHMHTLLSFRLPLQSVSVLLSPIGIIYQYIQQTEAAQLLCPGNACSQTAIKAERHPLPPAPVGAWEWRGEGEQRGRGGREDS